MQEPRLPSGTNISHYEIISCLGAGGMGEVYLAKDTRLDRSVALKLLPAEVVGDQRRMSRFFQEAKVASALTHRNICVIHEVDESDDGRPFISMEYVEGQTLDAKINGQPLTNTDIVNIAIQVADALVEAHSKGVIHRDIKPSNIVITSRGQVKVLDFGLAKVANPVEEGLTSAVSTQAQTAPGLLVGTFRYMSPEQALAREVDHRTDIFSLGIVIYEMATGRSPFAGQNPMETLDQIIHSQPEAVSRANSQISPELERIICKCLEKDPDQRYASSEDVLLHLRQLKSHISSASSVTPRSRILSGFRPRQWLFYSVIFGLLTILTALYFYRQHNLDGRSTPVLPAEKYIAVVPLRSVGNEALDQIYSLGLTTIVTRKLAVMEQSQRSLWVVPISDMQGQEAMGVSQAYQKFGVNLVLTGQAERIEDRIRLGLQLVHAGTESEMDSREIEESLANVSVIREKLVLSLVEMLRLELTPELRSLLGKGDTMVPAAFEMYVSGCGTLQLSKEVEDYDQAMDYFEKAIREDPGFTLAYVELAAVCSRKYQTTRDAQWLEKALGYAKSAVDMNHDFSLAHVILGFILADANRHKESVEEFQKALQIDSLSADAYRGLGLAHEKLGQYKEAESTYQKAIYFRQKDWTGFDRLGLLYRQQHRYEAAINQFRKVLELAPENQTGYNRLGALYFYLERWADARQLLERSLQIKPNYVAYSDLGSLDFYQQRYADAARRYESALSLDGRDYRLWGNLAAAYYWAPDERNKAQATYRQAIEKAEKMREVHPDDPAVLSDLAGYYGVLIDHERALPLIWRMLELAPDDPHVVFHAGQTYEQLGERSQALGYVKRSIELGYSRAEIEGNPWMRGLCADRQYQQLTRLTN